MSLIAAAIISVIAVIFCPPGLRMPVGMGVFSIAAILIELIVNEVDNG